MSYLRVLAIAGFVSLMMGCTATNQPMPATIALQELAPLLKGQMLPHVDKEEEQFWMREDDHTRVVALRKVVKVAPDELAVLTRSLEAIGEGKDVQTSVGYASSGDVDVHYVHWDGHHWVLRASYIAALSLGSSGEFGDVEVMEPKRGLKAFLIHSGGTWQGYTVDAADLVLLDHGKPHSVLEVTMASDSGGACVPELDCWEATSRLIQTTPSKDGQMADLRLEQTLVQEPSPLREPAFEGLNEEAQKIIRQRMEETPPKRRQIVSHSTLVYRWDGRQYVLRMGKNLVPSV